METYELTEYEQDRQPQEIFIDTQITIPSRSLYREIICPICLEVLTSTRAAPDCMHRFCKDCIEKAVNTKTVKNCPICGKKMPQSTRGFKKDPKFDQLISMIKSGDNLKNDILQEPIKAPECEIILKPLHGQQTRFIKCPHTATVDHLAKYLSMRPETSKNPPKINNNGLTKNGNSHNNISSNNNGNTNDNNNNNNNNSKHDQYILCIVANRSEAHYESLQGTLKIEDIRSTYNLVDNKPLEIYFYLPNDK